jgi:NAD(P)-dependent dehydrogenase (short-subunit alcohol dehydrogenase family)
MAFDHHHRSENLIEGEIFMKHVILVTGASSAFGALAARRLAKAGHIVYASMHATTQYNAPQVQALRRFALEQRVDLRTIDLDVKSESSAEASVETVLRECGRLDVVVHNAGHMVFGPAEAFTPDQLAELYNMNVLSTQRVNCAALPVLRRQGKGLVVWLGSSSTRGAMPPYLGPYFAAIAAMDALALSYAGELALWNIETSIVVPGALTSSTSHFDRLGLPNNKARLEEYQSGPTSNLGQRVMKGFEAMAPLYSNAVQVAEAIVKLVAMPLGTRPLRVHVDGTQPGAMSAMDAADHVREVLLRKMGLGDLLRPSSSSRRERVPVYA